jgi:hypothetical protein
VLKPLNESDAEALPQVAPITKCSRVGGSGADRLIVTANAWCGSPLAFRIEEAIMSGESSRAKSPPICRSRMPTLFKLVINFITAKAIGLTIPELFLPHRRGDRIGGRAWRTVGGTSIYNSFPRPGVAVGTRIAPRPPHRSRRALLTHRAPPSGFGVEAVTWQRV